VEVEMTIEFQFLSQCQSQSDLLDFKKFHMSLINNSFFVVQQGRFLNLLDKSENVCFCHGQGWA